MMPTGGRNRAEQFLKFAIRGALAGKTAEQLADEYMELMGWNAPPPTTAPEAVALLDARESEMERARR